MLIVTTITYLNHFDNGFHFDDSHTIENNPFIRSLHHIPSFFTDGTTFSSLPQNQSYRPLVSTSLAIDYWLAGNTYNTFFFHLTSYILYLFLGIFLFLFSHKIFNISYTNKYNFYLSAIVTLWFMLHPVMAETINYIIARSDLQSTFFVVLAFVLYQYSSLSRKYFLYLIPIILGTLAKPTAVMFAPIFLAYIILFKYNSNFKNIISFKNKSLNIEILKYFSPAILLCVLIYLWTDFFTPTSFSTGSQETLQYLITQPLVIAYYAYCLLFPIHLSADTDWTLLKSIWSYEFFLGISFLISLLFLIFKTSNHKKLFPISFGLLWFLFALAPTSSLIPLAEVMNDHRMFFPFIGLIISVIWSLFLLFEKIKKTIPSIKYISIITVILMLTVYAYGTHKRNIIWDNDESLWKDVTIKSPNNGRGLMNYGLTQMAIGNYDVAKDYFMRALSLTPRYHSLHINLGILYNVQGSSTLAESHFKKAIQYGPDRYNSWFYYGRYLKNNSKYTEAITHLNKALEISPTHIPSILLLLKIHHQQENWEALNQAITLLSNIDSNHPKVIYYKKINTQRISLFEMKEIEIDKNPSPEKYLNLSLEYYKLKKYDRCIEIAQKAIKLNPNYAEAYNNICTSLNLLGDYDQAALACKKALEINPKYILALNNLNDIESRKNHIHKLKQLLNNDNSEFNYIQLSLAYYKYGSFQKCIDVSKQTLLIHTKSDKSYNNICAAYNELKKWNLAIKAANDGLEINPKNQLLRNNLNWAINNLKK